jgi:hypothetical protein
MINHFSSSDGYNPQQVITIVGTMFGYKFLYTVSFEMLLIQSCYLGFLVCREDIALFIT